MCNCWNCNPPLLEGERPVKLSWSNNAGPIEDESDAEADHDQR